MVSPKIFLVLVTHFVLGSAQADGFTFRPNCSLPSTSTRIVVGPNVRGTLEILWSSLFTLLICCWTILHLNIPSQLPRRKKTIWHKAWNHVHNLLPKAKWMLLTLLIPEFLLGKALQDWHLAKISVAKMDAIATKSGFVWTRTHGFYTNSGGFALKAHSKIMEGKIQTPIFLNVRSLEYVCGEGGLIERLPTLSEEEIKDKSKGDHFIKIITAIQLAWSVAQVIARGVRGLAIPALEIMVLAYAACTIITIFLCLDKPKDVNVPTILPVKTDVGGKAINGIHRLEIERRRPQSWFNISLRLSRYRQHKHSTDLLQPIPNDARYDDTKSAFLPNTVLTRMDDGFTIAGMVFGGIHCAAWNFQFPTPIERLLWRIASVMAAGILPLYYLLLLADFRFRSSRFSQSIIWVLETVLMVSYFLARLYLLVEVFVNYASLLRQPSSTRGLLIFRMFLKSIVCLGVMGLSLDIHTLTLRELSRGKLAVILFM